MVWFGLGLLCACTSASRPPLQTSEQRKKVEYWNIHASNFSYNDRALVFAELDSKKFKDAIKDVEPINKMSASDLLDWFDGTVRATNIIHTFDRKYLNSTRKLNYIPNAWEAMVVSGAPPNPPEDVAETKIFHCKPFAKKLNPTWDEAVERPLYLSVNIWRLAWGQPFYGELNLVLNPSETERIIIAPVDTGGYAGDCLPTHQPQGVGTQAPNCSVWSKDGYPMGTFDHFHHLIMRHNIFYGYPLSELFRRMAGKSAASDWEYHHYYEADLMGAFYIPEHVHFLVANYSVFATNTGVELQSWAQSIKRPLAWSGDKDLLVVDAEVNHLAGRYVVQANDVTVLKKLWSDKAHWDVMESKVTKELQFRLRVGTDARLCVGIVIGVAKSGGCLYANNK